MDLRAIGLKISEKRQQLGISIIDLASKADFSTRSIMLIENGQALLTLEQFLVLCDSLDMTPNELLAGQYRSMRTGVPIDTQAFADTQDYKALKQSLINEIKRELAVEEAQEEAQKPKKDNQQLIQEIDKMISEQKYNKSASKSQPVAIPKAYRNSRWI